MGPLCQKALRFFDNLAYIYLLVFFSQMVERISLIFDYY